MFLHKKTDKPFLKKQVCPFWRRRWDSNPRGLAPNTISSRARYDHFDTSPHQIIAMYCIRNPVGIQAQKYKMPGKMPLLFSQPYARQSKVSSYHAAAHKFRKNETNTLVNVHQNMPHAKRAPEGALMIPSFLAFNTCVGVWIDSGILFHLSNDSAAVCPLL